MYAAANVVAALQNWTFQDFDAYWMAALRLRGGQDLYPLLVNPDLGSTYRYAPWFAYLWVPFTYLPRAAVELAWAVVLVAATVAALVPLVRTRTRAAICAAALLGTFLFWTAAYGNVQPLLVAGLVWLVPTRAGSAMIGVAASLKAFPILFVAAFLRRGQWRQAILAIAVCAVLTLPMLAFDLSHYPLEPGKRFWPGPCGSTRSLRRWRCSPCSVTHLAVHGSGALSWS